MHPEAQTVDEMLEVGVISNCAANPGHEPSPAAASEDFVPVLQSAFERGGVHVVVVPVDYSENTRVLVDQLQNRVPAPSEV